MKNMTETTKSLKVRLGKALLKKDVIILDSSGKLPDPTNTILD